MEGLLAVLCWCGGVVGGVREQTTWVRKRRMRSKTRERDELEREPAFALNIASAGRDCGGFPIDPADPASPATIDTGWWFDRGGWGVQLGLRGRSKRAEGDSADTLFGSSAA